MADLLLAPLLWVYNKANLFMKKIVASVGLAALGASALPNASAQGVVAPDTSKPWSIAASLRGFYDDNTATLPNNVNPPAGEHRSSFGFEVSPSGALNWSPQEQTTINLGLLYSLKYYDNTPPFSSGHTDQTFTFNAGISHAFNEELKARASDSFVIGQEPDMLRAGNSFATFQRISGDNIRNYGSVGLDYQAAPKLGFGFGYDNAFYDYKAHGASIGPSGFFGIAAIIPSPAGVLNRDENRAHVEALYQIMPETKAILGYQFTEIDYSGNEYIGGFVNPFFGGLFDAVTSDSRNVRQHTVYVGLEHTFLPELTGSLRAGASYSDYYNDPSSSATYSPYVLASLRYTYARESYIEAGFSYDRSPTDVVGLSSGGSFALDAEAAVFYANLRHRLLPMLYGSLMGQFQNNIYNGGAFNNETDQYYLLGLELEYRFTPNFSAHLGYDYDKLDSSINGRAFDRNRVYIGVTASY